MEGLVAIARSLLGLSNRTAVNGDHGGNNTPPPPAPPSVVGLQDPDQVALTVATSILANHQAAAAAAYPPHSSVQQQQQQQQPSAPPELSRLAMAAAPMSTAAAYSHHNSNSDTYSRSHTYDAGSRPRMMMLPPNGRTFRLLGKAPPYQVGASPGLTMAGPSPILPHRQVLPRHHGQLATRIVPGFTFDLPDDRHTGRSGFSGGVARILDMRISNSFYSHGAGPRIAEFSIANSIPPPQVKVVSPMAHVVTPTDSDADPGICQLPVQPGDFPVDHPAASATNNPFATGCGHRSNFPSDIDINRSDVPKYTYGRIRRYSKSAGNYGKWEPLVAYDPIRAEDAGLYMDRPCVVQLKRGGGMIRYFPRIVSEDRRATLAAKCRDFQEYRQYKFGPGGLANEPRVHVLLSANAVAASDGDGDGDNANAAAALAPGYQYHGIKMQAKPMSSEPAFAALSTELAAAYGFPNQEWNIGCDAIIYRNGNDNIGWHSDDTQGESKVTCIVPESPGTSRPVHVRPKRSAKIPLKDGDEEIQLFVRQGDGYEMNGLMQGYYEHCLPKVKKVQGLRSALIFRQGAVASVRDSGNRIADSSESHAILAPPAALPVIVGHPPLSTQILEGNDSYSRADLFLTRVHRCDRRGVCGNIENGAESIVVSRQDQLLREEDGLQWIKYTSSRRQGGGGFATSYKKSQPIRVFRSSSLNNKYAPPPRSSNGHTSYRYDGLYRVLFIWDEHGNRMKEGPSPNGAQYTFFLRRLPKVDGTGENMLAGNHLSTKELWDKICRRKEQPASSFVPDQPITYLTTLPLLPPTCRSRKESGTKTKTKSTADSETRAVDRAEKESASIDAKVPQTEKRGSVEEPSNINASSEAPADVPTKSTGDAKIEINWVQCDKCDKWRILPEEAAKAPSDGVWCCEMNVYDPFHSICDAPEQDEDEYIQSLEEQADDDDSDDDFVPSLTEIDKKISKRDHKSSPDKVPVVGSRPIDDPSTDLRRTRPRVTEVSGDNVLSKPATQSPSKRIKVNATKRKQITENKPSNSEGSKNEKKPRKMRPDFNLRQSPRVKDTVEVAISVKIGCRVQCSPSRITTDLPMKLVEKLQLNNKSSKELRNPSDDNFMEYNNVKVFVRVGRHIMIPPLGEGTLTFHLPNASTQKPQDNTPKPSRSKLNKKRKRREETETRKSPRL